MRTRSGVIVCQLTILISSLALLSGCVGLVNANNAPLTVSMSASPRVVRSGASTTLTIKATGAIQIVLTNNVDNSTQLISPDGGSVTVNPSRTTSYTATATGDNRTAAAETLVLVSPGVINHVLFLMQENRTFDSYFGMLNPYRKANNFEKGDDGKLYDVDGIDDKLTKISNVSDEGQSFGLFKFTSTCIDDDSSAWLQSYGDVNRFDFHADRPILMDGFVHTAEDFAKFCNQTDQNGQPNCPSGGDFTDVQGKRAMGYYDQGFLNYYYWMASQFALSDRWFSPVSSESVPNRIATMTGGTTQGLVHDPGSEDKLNQQLDIPTIFQELENAHVSWKIYYSTTQDQCLVTATNCPRPGFPINRFPATTFESFTYSGQYLYVKDASHPTCVAPTQDSGTAVGDPKNSFCIDVTHVAPLPQLITDMNQATLPSFSYVEPGYSNDDEHPGSNQSILKGQLSTATLINALMASPSWQDSAFFFSYDEGGGPYDHVPPVPGHTNDNTDPSLGITTDVSSIAVNPDAFNPCVPTPAGGPPTLHCDLNLGTAPSSFADPGADPADAPAQQGFAAQLGFRLPNMIVSPYTRRHYVSHTPIDHTAVIKYVENRFIGPGAHLTNRDAAQPDLSEFFDFQNVPWAIPPTPPTGTPVPNGIDPNCHAGNMGP
ncbi:MAG TPA: alkaline phosphatase family protein [Terriglobales bacterium]|nr:alkaline phosphatase family protein [Terriglobales bacterium]